MNPDKTCSSCRYWFAESQHCRAHPLAIPTLADYGCGEHKQLESENAAHFGNGRGKADDTAIIEMVRAASVPDEDHGHFFGVKRADLVKHLMEEHGITSTPAHKRIERLVRKGIFRQGKCQMPPALLNGYVTPGIWIWMDLAEEKTRITEAAEPVDRLASFVRILRAVAPDGSKAKSLRAIQRAAEGAGDSVSVPTIHNRMNKLIAERRAARNAGGYYATPVAAPAPDSLDAD